MLLLICVVPLTILLAYLLIMTNKISSEYDGIVRRITKANAYNINFKEDMDYVMYIIVVNSERAEELVDTEQPHRMIQAAREVFGELYEEADSEYAANRLSSILNSEKLAAEINKQACKSNIVMPVLLEVNMGREAGKGGVIPEEADNECAIIQTYKTVRLDGIMCVFPKNAKENLYAEAESLYNRLQEKYNLKILSMGMSDDYVTALKHGANMIRLGRAIFGERGKFYER